uniref:DDE-1 domain-containing protein n=1 Tax=Amphimedon queenslandica TaxID=400682 RepID=A0A1X7UNP5_AMPQE
MTGKLLDEVLMAFNGTLIRKRRFILLFMDNAGCHPDDRKIDTCTSASEVAQSINVLTAVRWISQAWNEVKPETITKCFKSAGMLNSESEVHIIDEDDPFASLDSDFNELITQTVGTNGCSADEYLNGDNDLPICVQFDDEKWDEEFLESLSHEEVASTCNDLSDIEDFDILPPPPKLKNYAEATVPLSYKFTYSVHDTGAAWLCIQAALVKVHLYRVFIIYIMYLSRVVVHSCSYCTSVERR